MKIKLILAILACFLLLGGISYACTPKTPVQPASVTVTDKYDGDCTDNDLGQQGRCSNKPLVVSEPTPVYIPEPVKPLIPMEGK